jgi:hypothetical protein
MSQPRKVKSPTRSVAAESVVSQSLLKEFDAIVMNTIAGQLTPEELAAPELGRRMSPVFSAALSASADWLWNRVREGRTTTLRDRREMLAGFECRLFRTWRRPLDMLESLVELAHETGDAFAGEHLPTAVHDRDVLLQVVVQMHARACQIAGEVLVLLRSGFADGAHARWRTMHELAVTASFLKEQGVEAARMYVRHRTVEAYRAALQYQVSCRHLHFPRIPAAQMKRQQSAYDALRAEMGKDFCTPYGWAGQILGKPRPSFADIEAKAELDHLRPFYKMASYNVHATPQRIWFSLGYPDRDELPAGPSNLGLTDPAQCTGFTLAVITATLVAIKPSFLGLAACLVLQRLAAETSRAFLSVQRKLEQKELALRGKRG